MSNYDRTSIFMATLCRVTSSAIPSHPMASRFKDRPLRSRCQHNIDSQPEPFLLSENRRENTSTQNEKQKQGAVFCSEFTVNNFIARWWSCGNALSSSQMFTLATNKLLFERSRFVDRMTSRTRMPWRNWFSLCAKKRWAENMQQQKKIINPLKLD